MLFLFRFASAQKADFFDKGLQDWTINGEVQWDSLRGTDGSSCARLGAGSSMIQSVKVLPFSILQFTMDFKGSNEQSKGFSYIKFYNAGNQELLVYKSAPLSGSQYQNTGNYTEAPPFTQYAVIGIETDSLNTGYIYTDNFKLNLNIGLPDPKNIPACNPDEYMKPFWHSDTVINETVLLYSEKNKPATGRLLFEPDKILSVKRFDLQKNFKKNTDYQIQGRTITRSSHSTIPFRVDTSFDTKNDLAWYNLQSQWVVVSYIHHDPWNGPVVQYKGNQLPDFMAKLKSKSPVKIIGFGMSITRGMNISSYDQVAPFMPSYLELFTREIRKQYGYADIELTNAGLPGALVSWGAAYAEKYINPVKPDLVILDFGMNDFWRYTPAEFKKYTQTIIDKVKAGNAKTSFLLISNMDFDPDYILSSDKNKSFYTSNMQGYKRVLQELETMGIINLDMTTLSDAIYRRKKAKDCITNPLHPNDYMARWYAQCLAALICQ